MRIPITTLLKEQDARVDKRVEEAMNRMTEVLKEFKTDLKEFKAELKADLERSTNEKLADLDRSTNKKLADLDRSTDEKLETFYWKLVVTLSGVIAVLVPSSVLCFEFFGGRILFPGNR